MKKNTQFAYIRKSHSPQYNQQSITPDNNHQQLSKAILGQMNKTQTEYLQKLMAKSKNKPEILKLDIDSIIRNDEASKKIEERKTMTNHERTKSFGVTVSNNKTPGKDQYLFSYRGEKSKPIISNKFYSNTNTPISQKNNQTVVETDITHQQRSHQLPKRKNSQFSLIQSIDNYLDQLNTQMHHSRTVHQRSYKQVYRKDRGEESQENVSIQQQNIHRHGNQQTPQRGKSIKIQSQLLKKLEQVNNYAKSLKLSNHILESQNKKLIKKQQKMKKKMYSMLEHIRQLTASLQHERHERKKAQRFFKQIQNIQKRFHKETQHKKNYLYEQFSEMIDSQPTSQSQISQQFESQQDQSIDHQMVMNVLNSFNSTKKINQKTSQKNRNNKEKGIELDIDAFMFEN